MTGSQPDEPVLVALLTADPPPAPLAELETLDDRLGVVSLPADRSPERLASVDPDCAVVGEDRIVDGLSTVEAYDADLPTFRYRDESSSTVTDGTGSADVPASEPAPSSANPPAVAEADASDVNVVGVLTHCELIDAAEVPTTTGTNDTATTETDDTATTADSPADGAARSTEPGGPVARIVSAVSDYWMPDDVRLRDVALDAVSVGVTITDPSKPDNPLVYVNEQFTRITGYAEHEILGRNCRFLQGPETDPESVTEIRRAVDEGQPTFVELRNYHKNGTPFRNELQILPITDEGEVVNFLGLQRDVTEEHRRAETEARVADARHEVRAVARDGSESPTARIERLLALGRETLGVGNAHLVVVDPERDRHEVVRADGSSLVERGDTAPLSESYCRHSLDGEAGFAFHDPADPDLADDPAHERHGAGCYLSEPVYREGSLYGTCCFADETPREAFTEAERQFAVLLSAEIGRLLEQHRGDRPLRDD
jgi:PAS domain S-box-containing protein